MYRTNVEWPEWKPENTRFSDVLEPDACFAALHEMLVSQERAISKLNKINKELKDEKYESKEIQKMKEERDKAKEELRRGFSISKKEDEAMGAWIRKHMNEKHSHLEDGERVWNRDGAAGGRFSYTFTPTGLGTIGTIRCSCGEEFCFRELG